MTSTASVVTPDRALLPECFQLYTAGVVYILVYCSWVKRIIGGPCFPGVSGVVFISVAITNVYPRHKTDDMIRWIWKGLTAIVLPWVRAGGVDSEAVTECPHRQKRPPCGHLGGLSPELGQMVHSPGHHHIDAPAGLKVCALPKRPSSMRQPLLRGRW